MKSSAATASKLSLELQSSGIISSESLQIEQVGHSRDALWDDYVRHHPCGSPFHMSAWRRSISETFGYEPMYLAVTKAGHVRGVLPLFLVKNVLLGKALLSIPFAVYGGALSDTQEVKNLLREELIRLARALRVQHVELRNAYEDQALGFERISRYVTFTQDLEPEDRLLEAIPRKTRYMVRKALKQGFSTRVVNERSSAFENLYAQNLRKLGTPAFPSRFFEKLLTYFGDSVDIREVRLADNVASAVLTFYFRDQVLPYYGASDPALNAAAPNNYMYFDLMRWGAENGYRVFDFGRSKRGVPGSYDFKSHWGMVERELPYEMLLVRRKALPNLTPANPIFDTPRRLWQKLPLGVTRLVGPHLLKLVP